MLNRIALLLPAALLAAGLAAQTPATASPKLIKWMSMEEAQAAVKKSPKPLFVDVYTTWCGPCRMLDARTFSDARVADYVNKHFYPVKFNAESGEPVTFKGQKFENPEFDPGRVGGRNGTHQLTLAIANVQGRIAYPTIVYLDSDLNVLAPVQGLMDPPQIEPILNYFGEGHYKTQEYQAFLNGFKGKWGGQ
ncbi:MAG TPA: thioredoxin family protein [Flavobacteriales bacterium]|nr:thioredoxin family protein [Flavobacteriales bacterium]